jgi:acetolactate synthase regulatory subunit
MSAESSVAVRFMLDADAAPGLLTRLLQPFARRDLIPDRMWSHRAGDTMHVEIALEAMPGDAVHLVEGNLRQVVGVRSLAQVRPEAVLQAA